MGTCSLSTLILTLKMKYEKYVTPVTGALGVFQLMSLATGKSPAAISEKSIAENTPPFIQLVNTIYEECPQIVDYLLFVILFPVHWILYIFGRWISRTVNTYIKSPRVSFFVSLLVAAVVIYVLREFVSSVTITQAARISIISAWVIVATIQFLVLGSTGMWKDGGIVGQGTNIFKQILKNQETQMGQDNSAKSLSSMIAGSGWVSILIIILMSVLLIAVFSNVIIYLDNTVNIQVATDLICMSSVYLMTGRATSFLNSGVDGDGNHDDHDNISETNRVIAVAISTVVLMVKEYFT